MSEIWYIRHAYITQLYIMSIQTGNKAAEHIWSIQHRYWGEKKKKEKKDPRRWEKRETIARRTQATVENYGRLNSLKSIGTGGDRVPQEMEEEGDCGCIATQDVRT